MVLFYRFNYFKMAIKRRSLRISLCLLKTNLALMFFKHKHWFCIFYSTCNKDNVFFFFLNLLGIIENLKPLHFCTNNERVCLSQRISCWKGKKRLKEMTWSFSLPLKMLFCLTLYSVLERSLSLIQWKSITITVINLIFIHFHLSFYL